MIRVAEERSKRMGSLGATLRHKINNRIGDRKMLKRILSAVLVIFMIASLLTACREEETIDGRSKETVYQEALDYLEDGNYTEAYKNFKRLGNYSDAAEYAARFHYLPISYAVNMDDGSGDVIQNTSVTYNSSDMPVSAIIMDGSREYRYEYKYDSSGNLIEKISHAPDGKHVYTYTYEDGLCIYDVHTTPDGEVSRMDYTYNSKDQLIGVVWKQTELPLPEEGSDVEPDPSVNTYNITFEYDKNGRCVKDTIVYGDGTTDYCSYTYDGNGNVTKMVYGSTSGYIYYSYTTTYDSSNMPTKKVYTQGSEQMTHTFTYNESRTEVKVNTVSFDGENMLTTCKYRLAYIESDITDQQIEDILQDVIMFME